MRTNKIISQDLKYISEKFKQPELFDHKTIMLTGCAGFLGFNFVNYFMYLIENGIKIKSLILLDNFLLGIPEWIKEVEAAHYSEMTILKFDIARDDLANIQMANQVDYIIHMASIASPTYYRKYPLETIEANVWGLRNLLEYYRILEIEGFLFFSSSEIYGNPSGPHIPTSEEFRGNVSCLGPRACYDESKRFGETLCYVYAEKYGLPIAIARPFNNYGPGMPMMDKRLPADLAHAILSGENMLIHSDGSPTRTFCYVADAIIGYLKILGYGKFDCFNIGMDDEEITVQRLAEIYADVGKDLFNYRGNVTFKPSPDKNYLTHNPARRCPDISKARRILGYDPSIKVEDGVRRFLEYLDEEARK